MSPQPTEGSDVPARKPISKRLRYEILRRDEHTCRYCGGQAPDVKLTIDHVVPITLGGSDDPSNLVAACKDCNAGKSSVAPDSKTVEDVQRDALRWAAAMRRAAEIQTEQRVAFKEYAATFYKSWGGYYSLPGNCESSLYHWWKAGVEIDVLLEAVDVTLSARGVDWRWKYFCGVVWRRVGERQEIAQSLIADEDGT